MKTMTTNHDSYINIIIYMYLSHIHAMIHILESLASYL